MRHLLLCVISAGLVYAQLETGTIVGTVLDQSGAAIPQASVAVENQQTGVAVRLTTDSSGNYIAPVLRIGSYRVTASATGFKTSVQENIPLRVSDRVRVDVTLETGVVTEKVVVSAEAPDQAFGQNRELGRDAIMREPRLAQVDRHRIRW